MLCDEVLVMAPPTVQEGEKGGRQKRREAPAASREGLSYIKPSASLRNSYIWSRDGGRREKNAEYFS